MCFPGSGLFITRRSGARKHTLKGDARRLKNNAIFVLDPRELSKMSLDASDDDTDFFMLHLSSCIFSWHEICYDCDEENNTSVIFILEREREEYE